MAYIFNKNNTIFLKSILPIIIIIHHIYQKTDLEFLRGFFISSGEYVVSLFFFISGYGLTRSYYLKEGYMERFISKRIYPILRLYLIVIFIFQLYLVAINYNINLTQSIIALVKTGDTSTILPASWFVIDIVFFYFAFYIAFKLNNKIYKMFTILLLVFFYILYCYINKFGSYWWITTGGFISGILWAGSIEDRLVLNKQKCTIISIILFFILIFLSKIGNNLFSFTLYTLFPIFVVFLFYLVKDEYIHILCHNRIIKMTSSLSLEIYLLHIVVLRLFRTQDFNCLYIQSDLWYLIFTVSFTLILSLIINKMLVKSFK